MTKTIRTENKNKDYFDSKWSSYFDNLGTYGYLGHLHTNDIRTNYRLLGSSGYDGFYLILNINNINTLVIPDLHLGHPDTESNFNKHILPALLGDDIQRIIFLGDTFEMALEDDDVIRGETGFWNWLSITSKEIIFVIGNHDINLSKEKNAIRVYANLHNNKLKFVREYTIGKYTFAHGDKYDPFVQKFGLLYLTAFKLFDYTGKFGSTIWNKINTYFR